MFFVRIIYLVHQSAVVRRGRKLRYSLFLKGGEDVEFDVVEGK